jgi:hypothetical protein
MQTRLTIKILNVRLLIPVVFGFIAPLVAQATVYAPIHGPQPDPSATPGVTLPWNIGASADPAKIPCFRQTAPSNEELTNAILSYRSGKTTDIRLGSIQIHQDDIVLVAALDTLVRDSNGNLFPLNPAIAPRTDHPFDAIDVAKQVFGEREGLQILYLYLRYRIYASPFLVDGLAPWTSEELDSVLLALSDLPDHLVPFPLSGGALTLGFQPLLRNAHNVTLTNGGHTLVVLANSTMLFFDAWSKTSAMERRGTVLHEVAHNLQRLISDTQNWTDLSPWPSEIRYLTIKAGKSAEAIEKIKTAYRGSLVEPFATRYAKSSPGEDFAESVTAYRYRPDWLQERNPEKYAYLKEVIFDGIEYTSEAACARPKTDTEQFSEALRKNFTLFQLDVLGGRIPGTKETSELARENGECDDDLLAGAGDNLWFARKYHAECVGKIYLDWFNQREKKLALKYPADDRDVREHDRTGGIYTPALDYYTRAKLADFARAEVRNAILQDFRSFSATRSPALKDCDRLKREFPEWMVSQGERSSTARTKIFDTESGGAGVDQFIDDVCKTAFAYRPVYQRLFERVGLVQPLSYADFKTAARLTLGD